MNTEPAPASSQATTSTREDFSAERDLTVVIPTYNRSQYFLHYLREGLWDGVRIRLVCDGCDAAVVEQLKEQTRGRDVTVLEYQPNRGVAHAIGVGVRSVETSHFMFCGDDDFNVRYAAFLEEAAALKRRHDDVLFVSMPLLYAFNRDLQFQLQYDRRSFDGWTGLDVLRSLVRTGELRSLVAGSLFRTAEIRDVLPEPFFTVSEDYTLMVRLCARFPHRRIYVAGQGLRMRLVHDASLSARGRFTRPKMLAHLVSMVVGAFHLMALGRMDRPTFTRILLDRGALLQQVYGLGRPTAEALAALINASRPPATTDEARWAVAFLENHAADLPPEFLELAVSLQQAGRHHGA